MPRSGAAAPSKTTGGAYPYNSAQDPPAPSAGSSRAKASPAAAPSSSSTASSATPESKPKISQRLNPNKCTDPFQTNTKKCKSTFSQSYISGSIPCRLHTSASRYHLHWDQGATTGFSPDLLVVCADGLSETEHPYVILAPMMFHELVLRAEGCVDMFVPVAEPITSHIRKAMLAPETFEAGLHALSLVLQKTGSLLTQHMAKIVPCLAKNYADKKKRDSIAAVLGLLEQQCGPEATKLIKSKIPTY
ncbi:Hypothetical protein, putative [Bodo saltans]|uniref:PACRG-like protein n=1 Tax=Bodo saltans TaxID=75058 RepID=A0A0S4JJM4_BODSA|nr:Hypothetical protein, putative [Bodo saltans]|eukprot:CUG90303.1 Hypothetical protein, putative [Bodo saltans]